MKISVLILGGGGHAKVLIDCLLNNPLFNVLGILDSNSHLQGRSVLDIPVLGDENKILKKYHPVDIKLVNGIGSIGSTDVRKNIFQKWKTAGFHFLTVIHPTSYIARHVILGEGAQIMAGSVIQSGSHIGNNVIINTHSSIDHDCVVEDHVHVAPGVTCSGSVKIGTGSHVGTGAVIRQGIKIANDCLIAAGAVVIRDVVERSKVAGIPASSMT